MRTIDKSFNFSGGRKRQKKPVSVPTNWITRNLRGTEEWIICDTYKMNALTGEAKPDKRMFGINRFISLLPSKDVELIFYMTCVVDLRKLGLQIENKEAEAKVLNEKDAKELDVKFFILSETSSVSIADLRLIGRAWGISDADKISESLFRRQLLDRVNADEANKSTTKRGYLEFTQDVQGLNPEMLEARIVANMCLEKGVVTYDGKDRKLVYASTGEHLAIVPIDDMNRKADFLAALFLKKPAVFETAIGDVNYHSEVEPVSIADVEASKTRPELMQLAKRAGYKFSIATKTDVLREALIKHLGQN